MIYNFFKIALRNLQKHKLHSFINIFGLALGMTATLLIASYIFFEISYDKQNPEYQNVYRIYSIISLPNGESVGGPSTIGNVAPRILDEIPEITHSVRFTGHREIDIEYGGKVYSNDKFIWADSSFFDIMGFEFIAGNPKEALVHDKPLLLQKVLLKRYLEMKMHLIKW